ncbi:RNA-binding domain-containing protein [Rufibacter tibetensis]|uniref:Transcriptional regulator n=1 Tax=Rufibacter tibetensis TaxID=512763 RepID=A0A0P0CSK2_9BACT|nr:RNA-binding domain-containing protein [Rufibacter tibetensis]ALJ00439.1 transcriptional regulator [Rufibacter tibetensis]
MQEMYLLILQGESETLEFKKTITHPARIARTLVSFANTRGGQILVGVQDDGTVCGADPEEEKYSLDIAINTFCDPPVEVIYEEVDMDEGTVLKVIIPESVLKPHLAKVKEDDWRSYIRVKDESVQTSKLVEKSLTLEPATETIEEKVDYQQERILELLRKYRKLTIKDFMHMANLSKQRARRLLVFMVLQGQIRMHDKEKEPFYTLS